MRRFTTVLLVSVSCTMGMFALPSDASAQRVSLELAGGYDQFGNDLGYGDLTWPVLRYGNWFTARTGGLGIDGRLALSIGERWELGAVFSLKRATMNLVTQPTCFEHDVECPPRTLQSEDYTELMSSLATARFWPMGTPDRRRTVRPLVGLHSGFLWYDDGFDLADREFVEDQEFVEGNINQGVPIGIDAGIGMAISDRAYLLTYLTGQVLLVGIPDRQVMERDPFCDTRPHFGLGDPCTRTLEGDGFGFRWGVRAGIGIRL